MSHDIQLVLIGGLLSGGFALLGGGLTNRMATRRDEERFRTQTALELPDLDHLIWGEDFTELRVALMRHEASLAVASVADELIQALSRISRACWYSNRESCEQSGGEHGGISVSLLNANKLVQHAIRSYLLRNVSRAQREELRRKAIASVEAELKDWSDPSWY